jgi:hypothetical protein
MDIFKVILHNGLEFPYTVQEGQDKNTNLFPTFDSAWDASKLFAKSARDFTIVRYKINPVEIVSLLNNTDKLKGDDLNRIAFRDQVALTPTQAERVGKLKSLKDTVNLRAKKLRAARTEPVGSALWNAINK